MEKISNNFKHQHAHIAVTVSTIIAIISCIIAAIGVIISAIALAFTIASYNKRYEIDAKSAGSLLCEFDKGINRKDGNIVTLKGQFYYGTYQTEGPVPTSYLITYRRANKSRFRHVTSLLTTKNLTVDEQNNKICWGKVKTTKYVFRFTRTSNFDEKTTFIFDWMIADK